MNLIQQVWQVPTPDGKQGRLFISESAAESYRVSAAQSGTVLPEAFQIPVWDVPTTENEAQS